MAGSSMRIRYSWLANVFGALSAGLPGGPSHPGSRDRRHATYPLHDRTHRRHQVESKSLVVEDMSNGKYRWWYQLRLGKRKNAVFIRLPLLFNAKRKKPEDLRLDAAHVCYVRNGKQFMVGATHEAPPLAFPPAGVSADTSVGIDVNTKNNLMAPSNGRIHDYDRSAVCALILLVNKITRNGTPNMTLRERARWEKLCRANEWRIKRLIHDMLDDLQSAGVTDIMVEDLDVHGDATFLEHHALKIKYSRLLRLPPLSHLKDWIGSQAEKRGMRMHRTNPAYTSQECPECQPLGPGSTNKLGVKTLAFVKEEAPPHSL